MFTMTPTILERDTKPETPEEAKARRNAEYLAKLDKSFRELEEGKVFVTTLETLEAMTNE
jgi:hypothetical protein